ncbi:hypothetical protein L3556_04790 [Candidatus Synechococcus calcipolaris G9]|uniref:Type 4 fimbrial biogenesis protein PilX N-terminal domain-containing protein n=1 Tax=Candidatus Synechococcus calcipolaris G9 TaxID=1497997 RepID=A0ABT6EWV5_9SYNE|nr:hypothetical protein [Candidatus Synechococcus calcipolaris]MDG2990254.1 hypothetical protein [Candidatus Synechococcus calcipolaris G9]
MKLPPILRFRKRSSLGSKQRTFGRRSPRNRNRGFTLPMVVGMGLIMIVIALTIISRSQIDKVTSSVQKQTNQAFAIAEGGIARSLGLLNGNYQMFLRLTYNPINPTTNQPYLITRAQAESAGNVNLVGQPNVDSLSFAAQDQWTSPPDPPPCYSGAVLTDIILNGDIGGINTGTYELLAYLYDEVDSAGYLLLRGDVPGSPANAFVMQKINVVDKNIPSNFPGLMAENINLGNNDVLGSVSGNVICTNPANCVVPPASCVNGQPTNAGLRSAVGALSNSVIEGSIAVGAIDRPSVPLPPPIVGSIVDGNEIMPGEGAYNLGSLGNSSVKNYPRTGDEYYTDPETGEEYYAYVINNITLSGTNRLQFNTSNRPVYLFVTGNVSVAGQAGIRNTCSPDSVTCGSPSGMAGLPSGTGTPDRLRLYGNPSDNDNTNDQQITLSGGGTAGSMFIFAPDARVGINGGSSNPDIFGAVWAKEWNGSNSNVAEIQVPDNLPDLLANTGIGASITVARTTEATNWSRLAQY